MALELLTQARQPASYLLMRKGGVEAHAPGSADGIEARRVVDRSDPNLVGADVQCRVTHRNDLSPGVVRHTVRFVASEPRLHDANAPAFAVSAEFDVKDHGRRPTTTRSFPLRSRSISPRRPEAPNKPTIAAACGGSHSRKAAPAGASTRGRSATQRRITARPSGPATTAARGSNASELRCTAP